MSTFAALVSLKTAPRGRASVPLRITDRPLKLPRLTFTSPLVAALTEIPAIFDKSLSS